MSARTLLSHLADDLRAALLRQPPCAARLAITTRILVGIDQWPHKKGMAKAIERVRLLGEIDALLAAPQRSPAQFGR